MTDAFPDPKRAYPVTLPDGTEHRGTVFLDQVIAHPGFQVGAFTYASDFEPPKDWATHLAPYLFEGRAGILRIGKFCQIAHGVRFLTAGANHAMEGLTCFPFPIFDPTQIAEYQPDTRDTVIGHDVWFGFGALICPGARIGHGAVIGAGAVVRGSVPDYAVVVGNPGTIIRMRFEPDVVTRLLALKWWDWEVARIKAARPALMASDINTLEQLAP